MVESRCATSAVVIGAGLAGLSAAVRLCDARVRVTVLEKGTVPGGRVRRLAPGSGGRSAIDFGQHLMLGCYRQTRAYAERLGTAARLVPVDGATPFVSGPGRFHPYRVGRLPSPLHALPGLFGLTHLPPADRLGLGRAAVAAKIAVRIDPAGLDRRTAAEWLRRNGQGPQAIAGFWGPLVSATLNAPVEGASALLLATVIDKGLFAAREDAVPVLPRGLLHDVLIEPAVAAVRAAGGDVRTAARAARVVTGPGGRVRAVVTAKGEEVAADVFVLAVPPWDAPGALDGIPVLEGVRRAATSLSSSPIVGVEMWFRRRWLAWPFAALLDSPVHWLFDHADGRGARVSAVASHATDLAATPSEEVAAIFREEVFRFFPEALEAGPVSTLVVKAREATFAARPGQHALRPACRTPVPNLWLAGDWTATGLPATIEGAVASGRTAAEAALAAVGGAR
ncbi:MAG: FAD-dependent oxidoreductase [Deltaproteobacteria bacterium]|nr:FAD-dependent oxidoreductase [Deltaproteobacteria bacterium]